MRTPASSGGAFVGHDQKTVELRAPTEVAAPSPYAHLDRAMTQYAQGDEAAFPALHKGLAPRLQGFLLRLCGDPALAADLTQETFLRMHRARGTFAEHGAVTPWALTIARNTYRDRLRKNGRARSIPEALTVATDALNPAMEVPSHEGHGEQFMLAREVADIVRSTLAALPVLQREAFVLLRFEGLSVAEAADILGATASAVKLRAFRAYETLRSKLQEREEGI